MKLKLLPFSISVCITLLVSCNTNKKQKIAPNYTIEIRQMWANCQYILDKDSIKTYCFDMTTNKTKYTSYKSELDYYEFKSLTDSLMGLNDNYYSRVKDGTIYKLKVSRNTLTKSIIVSNYYLPIIEKLALIINNQVNKSDAIYFNKDYLIEYTPK